MTHKHTSYCTRGLTPEQRLDHYVPERPANACWLWAGTVHQGGYGVTNFGKRQVKAHRLAYEVWIGPIPEGLTIDHVRDRGCTSKLCCNPAHLEPVTSAENVRRGDGSHVRNSRKTRCLNDHEFDIERRVGDKVYRDCSICRLARQRKADGYTGVGRGAPGVPRPWQRKQKVDG